MQTLTQTTAQIVQIYKALKVLTLQLDDFKKKDGKI